MVVIQCSLQVQLSVGTFVRAFKKQISSQKNAYYAHLEALNVVKKDNDTHLHSALKVHQ